MMGRLKSEQGQLFFISATRFPKIIWRFAHLKRILKLGRLRLRGPRGAQDEFVLAAIAQNSATVRIAGHETATHSGSVQPVTLKLWRGRQRRRIKASRS